MQTYFFYYFNWCFKCAY